MSSLRSTSAGHNITDPMETSGVATPLNIDRAAFAAALGRHPLMFGHSLVGHPLLSLEAVAERADQWPAKWVQHHLADLPVLLPTGDRPAHLETGAGDVVRGLDKNGCWVVLWYVEMVPAYQALLDECLDQMAGPVEEREGRMGQRGANIFLSSPNAVTPAHFDRHHNLLLQVQGTKDVTIGVFDDHRMAQKEIERNLGYQHNLHNLPERQTTFHLQPGDGLYIPPYAFHWVQGGNETSISLSCGFRSPFSEQLGLVHSCNAGLRRIGLSPAPPGRSKWVDTTKAAAVQGRRRLEPLRIKALARLRSRS